MIAFTLASTDHATLDLVDLNGRRVFSWDVGARGPGPQSVALSDAGRLRPGVYFTRLTQGRSHHSKRIVVL